MYEIQESTMNRPLRRNRPASFAVGALIGAGVALLLAPAAGRETRRRLGHTAKRVGTNARGGLGRVRGVFDRTRHAIDEVKNDARSAVDAGRETFDRTRRPETLSGVETR